MPTISNITIKKNDGTTDVTYTAVQASGGDKAPAIFRNTTVGTAPGHQPQITIVSRANGTGTARRIDFEGRYPTLVTGSDGKISVSDRVIISASGVIPAGMPTADANEAVSQLLNALAHTLVKDSFKTGFAPT